MCVCVCVCVLARVGMGSEQTDRQDTTYLGGHGALGVRGHLVEASVKVLHDAIPREAVSLRCAVRERCLGRESEASRNLGAV